MDSQYKNSIDGVQSVKVENPKSTSPPGLLLRLLALVTTVSAAIVMGLAKETKTVPFSLISGMAPLYITVPAKMKYSSAFVYFVVANAIAAAYSLFSLVAMAAASRARCLTLFISVVDLIILALVSSGSGAAAAVGYLGYHGNKHVGWNKVCDVYGKFCKHVAVSVILSLIGSLAFVLLISLSVLNLHRRSR